MISIWQSARSNPLKSSHKGHKSMRNVGLPLETVTTGRYNGSAVALLACVEGRRRPQEHDSNYPLLTQWRVGFSTDNCDEGEIWQLIGFNDTGGGIWRRVMHTTEGPAIGVLVTDEKSHVCPDGYGHVEIDCNVVPNSGNCAFKSWQSAPGKLNFDIQVAKAIFEDPLYLGEAGVCSFDMGHFRVSKSGHVKLAGGVGPRITSLHVGYSTLPGEKTVTPDSDGQIGIVTNVVTAKNLPIAVHSYHPHGIDIELQVASATEADEADHQMGVCSFYNKHFDVNHDGYVRLANSGLSVSKINVDFSHGDYPKHVTPSDNGDLQISAGIARSREVPMRTERLTLTHLTVTSQVGCAAEYSEIKNAGMVSHDISEFIVDNHGFVNLRLPAGGPPGHTINLSLHLIDGVLRLMTGDSEWLSNWHSGYVVLKSNVDKSDIVVHKIKESLCIKPDHLKRIIHGTTYNVAWDKPMPLFVNIVVNPYDENPHLHLSRTPKRESIGSVRVVKDEGNEGAFVEFDKDDGIGCFQEERVFEMPTGQCGANLGSHIFLNGATYTPEFEKDYMGYTIYRDGTMALDIQFLKCTKAGVGAVKAIIPPPLPTFVKSIETGWDCDLISDFTLGSSWEFSNRVRLK